MVGCCLLFDVNCVLCVARCVCCAVCVVRCVMLVVRCPWLRVRRTLLFGVRCFLFIGVYDSLLFVGCRLHVRCSSFVVLCWLLCVV